MKVAAHPLVVAVAMGLLGPGALAEEPEGEAAPCTDCQGTAHAEGDVAEGELVEMPASQDPEVDSWLARPTPTADTQARALADYLAKTQA